MAVLTLALCARLSWLLVSFEVHIKSLHITDVTKLVKIRILTQYLWNANMNANRGICFISWNVVHWFKSVK